MIGNANVYAAAIGISFPLPFFSLYTNAIADVEFGIYYRRSATSSNVNIEQRWYFPFSFFSNHLLTPLYRYAHREIPNLLVHEIEVDATKSNTPVMLELKYFLSHYVLFHF